MSHRDRRAAEAPQEFGIDVFNLQAMEGFFTPSTFQALQATRLGGDPLDPALAHEVAAAIKAWAQQKGATHFTHWFQPLTGATAEKHDAFLNTDAAGGIITEFSAKDLIQGEPDASSLPSGGLRATFEARGYTAWDPTSPVFVRNAGTDRAVLCIPCVFCGYHGEALDEKTPLLRSQEALAKQLRRVGALFEIEEKARPYATLGAEQEYFLVDQRYFDRRPDLLMAGRTLFGRRPERHQQMEDHYFGSIKPRVLEFMADLDRALWRLGVPLKTRHNETAPAQFEVAPVFEEQNIAIDHNMLVMQTLKEIAPEHGFVCLLHEKPFAGVNGSGKHNNWSIVGTDGKNWFAPGATPHDNAKFLFMLVAVMKAVDTHAALIRSTVAMAGNDHRLGSSEAPPAILSIYLGDQLGDIIRQLEAGGVKRSKAGGHLEIGVSTLPRLPRDVSDRNRTSPFAFTGNKFEFRAVGASQSCSGPNLMLNLAMTWALDEMCSAMEAALPNPRPARDANGHTAAFHAALHKTLQAEVKAHRRILFDGDGYSDEWRQEAAKRGLPNLATTPEALEAMVSPESLALGAKYGVLTEREARSRYEVSRHAWEQRIRLEGECALSLARRVVLPAALAWERELSQSAALERDREQRTAGRLSGPSPRTRHYGRVNEAVETLYRESDHLEGALQRDEPAQTVRDAMAPLREAVDALEGLLPESAWPLPSYRDMLLRL